MKVEETTFAIDKEIKRCEEIAEEKFNNAVDIMDKMRRESDIAISKAEECKKCAEEYNQIAEWLKDYKRILEKLSCSVSREVLAKVIWERDVAIKQLKELGYELRQKIKLYEDCISRQAVLDLLIDAQNQGITHVKVFYFIDLVENLPPIAKSEGRNCISRQAVLDLLNDAQNQDIIKLSVFYFIDLVENLPPYKVESEG